MVYVNYLKIFLLLRILICSQANSLWDISSQIRNEGRSLENTALIDSRETSRFLPNFNRIRYSDQNRIQMTKNYFRENSVCWSAANVSEIKYKTAYTLVDLNRRDTINQRITRAQTRQIWAIEPVRKMMCQQERTRLQVVGQRDMRTLSESIRNIDFRRIALADRRTSRESRMPVKSDERARQMSRRQNSVERNDFSVRVNSARKVNNLRLHNTRVQDYRNIKMSSFGKTEIKNERQSRFQRRTSSTENLTTGDKLRSETRRLQNSRNINTAQQRVIREQRSLFSVRSERLGHRRLSQQRATNTRKISSRNSEERSTMHRENTRRMVRGWNANRLDMTQRNAVSPAIRREKNANLSFFRNRASTERRDEVNIRRQRNEIQRRTVQSKVSENLASSRRTVPKNHQRALAEQQIFQSEMRQRVVNTRAIPTEESSRVLRTDDKIPFFRETRYDRFVTRKSVTEGDLRREVTFRNERIDRGEQRTQRRVAERSVSRLTDASNYARLSTKTEDKSAPESWWWEQNMPKSLDVVVALFLVICEVHALAKTYVNEKPTTIDSAVGFLLGTTKA